MRLIYLIFVFEFAIISIAISSYSEGGLSLLAIEGGLDQIIFPVILSLVGTLINYLRVKKFVWSVFWRVFYNIWLGFSLLLFVLAIIIKSYTGVFFWTLPILIVMGYIAVFLQINYIKKIHNNFNKENAFDADDEFSSKLNKISYYQKKMKILKTKGILTEQEYTIKTNELSSQENAIKSAIKNDKIQQEVKKLMTPELSQLKELKNANILTDEEFNEKEAMLIQKYSNIIQEKG